MSATAIAAPSAPRPPAGTAPPAAQEFVCENDWYFFPLLPLDDAPSSSAPSPPPDDVDLLPPLEELVPSSEGELLPEELDVVDPGWATSSASVTTFCIAAVLVKIDGRSMH